MPAPEIHETRGPNTVMFLIYLLCQAVPIATRRFVNCCAKLPRSKHDQRDNRVI